MIKWPVKLNSGREAGKLPGIGPSISTKLQSRLIEHEIQNGQANFDGQIIDLDEDSIGPLKTKLTAASSPKKKRKVSTEKRAAKEYVPSFRSGPYAVLIALFLHLHSSNSSDPLNRSELIVQAQPLATAPLTDGVFPAINGALKTLETKGLIARIGTRYALKRAGGALAERLWSQGERREGQPQFPPLDPSKFADDAEEADLEFDAQLPKASNGPLKTFTWPAGTFEIVLLVDVREIRSRDDRNYLSERLTQMGIPSEVRNLELGDFVWIARRRPDSENTGLDSVQNNFILNSEEIVLDTLIERKREDDLCASLSDGRFKEQKHRIARSLLKNTFYLVERGSTAGSAVDYLGGGEERLLSATLQCQLQDGLMYRQTSSMEESISLLGALHRGLVKQFAPSSLTACLLNAQDFSFSDFPRQFRELQVREPVFMNYTAYCLLNSKSQNQSNADIFLKQLLTVKGVTFDKAAAILRQIPSPRRLYEFYQEKGGEAEKEAAFKHFQVDGKAFGPALSKKIYQVFGRRN